MKAKIFTAIAFVAIIALGATYDMFFNQPNMVPVAKKIVVEAKPAPNFTLNNFAGEPFSLSEFKEDIIILNFWAAWCSTCIAEIPDMLELTKEYKGKVGVVFVSIDDKAPSAQKHMARWQKKIPELMSLENTYWLWDEKKNLSLKTFNLVKVPETIIINKNRMMVDKIIGEFNWSGKEIRTKLNDILAQK